MNWWCISAVLFLLMQLGVKEGASVSVGSTCTSGGSECSFGNAECDASTLECKCSTGYYGADAATTCDQVQSTLAMPFGEGVNDNRFTFADTTDECVELSLGACGIYVDDVRRNKVFICENGFLSFEKKYQSGSVPKSDTAKTEASSAVMVAPYFSNIDARKYGRIYYHLYPENEIDTLTNVKPNAKALLSLAGHSDSNILFLLVVTWEQVVLFGKSTTEIATFQLTIIGDSNDRVFAFFSYQEGGMLLINPDHMIALMLPTKQTILVASDPYESLTYQGKKGIYFQTLNTKQTANGCTVCKNWIKNEPSLSTAWSKIPTCPCSEQIAKLTGQYKVLPTEWFSSQTCYSIKPSLRNFGDGNVGSVCCYNTDGGTYVQAKPDVGFKTRWNPIKQSLQASFRQTLTMKSTCCSNGLCDEFFTVRPANDQCDPEVQLTTGSGTGDPHVITMDGKSFTFNGHGEFVLIKIQTETVDMSIQGRMDPAVNAQNQTIGATAYTGFAAIDNKDGSQFMAILNQKKNGLEVYANGLFVTNAFINAAVEGFSLDDTFGDSVQLNKPNNDAVGAFFSNSQINLLVSRLLDTLTISISVPGTRYNGTAKGLYGNINGNPNDDFIARNGTQLPSDSTEKTVYEYGKTWRVQNADESAFVYAPGDSYAKHQNLSFVPNFLEDVPTAEREAAEAVCGLTNAACIFDKVLTGRDDIALKTKDVYQKQEDETKLIENRSPQLTVDNGVLDAKTNKVNVELGKSTAVSLKSVDDGTSESLRYSITSGQTAGNIPNTSSTNDVDLTIHIQNTNPVTLSVSVADELGATSPEVVVGISLCTGCSSQGTCDYTIPRDSTADNENFMVAKCVCEPFYQGDDCEADFDGCADIPCSLDRTCTDVESAKHREDGVAYTCGPCPSGYTDDGQNGCSDINECSNSTLNLCTDKCINNDGGFTCECNAGRRLSADKVTCTDINECQEATHNCKQVCNNHDGGFNCSCLSGYIYNGEANTCTLSNAALCQSAGCSASNGGCYVDGTDAKCFCDAGFELGANNICENINECDQGVCTQTCADTVGSFRCGCRAGFKLNADLTTCSECNQGTWGESCANFCSVCSSIGTSTCDRVRGCVCNDGWKGANCSDDIQECDIPNICPDLNSKCVNGLGSFTCECLQGYVKNASDICVDFDECLDATINTCSQDCINTIGSFACKCKAGFVKNKTDDTQCIDVDECTSGSPGCEQVCVNGKGSYNCVCYFGYTLNDDRKTCTKLDAADVCLQQNLKCEGFCKVTDTSASCDCGPGYRLASDNQACIDVDECAASEKPCSDTCINFVGGYNCTCPAGKALGGDGQCRVCDTGFYGDSCSLPCNCGVGSKQCDPITGCICEDGWTGTKCDQDKNECDAAPSPCQGSNVQCLNTAGSYQCKCSDGYENNTASNTCEDINECLSDSLNNCEQTCTNIDGSFRCSCGSGFNAEGPKCIDIDECSGVSPCEQNCQNTVGGFKCGCQDGFKLNTTDRQSCIVEAVCDATAEATCGANTQCVAGSQGVQCVCLKGFEKANEADTACTDIKECATSPCEQTCNEADGSFSCSCTAGYALGNDLLSCEACPVGKWGVNCQSSCTCDLTKSTCGATTGECDCQGGWTGTNCDEDIDECANDASICADQNSQCINTDGSYVCQCNTGYEKRDGTCQACSNIFFGDNCESRCTCEVANTASCNHIDGSCVCNSGWRGTTCAENIDECAEGTAQCIEPNRGQCFNTEGSYRCDCDEGYTLGTGNKCEDINECVYGSAECEQECNNTVGSFNCYCSVGFTGTGTNCQPCPAWKKGIQCVDSCTCNVTNSDSCNAETGECVCKTGWTGSNCNQDINECEDTTICGDANAQCVNSNGSYSCPCKVGYKPEAGTCAACTNSKFGTDCSSTCDCVDNNVVDSSQSCDHVTGTCQCNSFWTGPRCATDVDECSTDTHTCRGANEGCHNIDRGFSCSCLRGFTRDSDGNCVTGTTVAPPVIITNATVLAARVKITLNYSLGDADLSLKQTYDAYVLEVKTNLLGIYQRRFPGKSIEVVIHSIEAGSLNIDYSVVFDSDSLSGITKVIGDIASGDESVTVFGESAPVTAMTVDGGTVATGDEAKTEANICAVYAITAGACKTDEKCTLDANNEPFCKSLKTDDNFSMLLGLGIGVPLGFIVILLLGVILYYYFKRKPAASRYSRRVREPPRSSAFAEGIPTRMGHGYGRGPYYGSEFEDESADPHGYPRAYPHFEGGEPISNFSWDFLYNYIDPRSKYEIQRPKVNHQAMH